MKSTIIKSLVVALVAVGSVTLQPAKTVNAQEGQVGLVAVLDVAKVFKENKEFDSQMQAIRAEADQLKQSIAQEQEAIKSSAQELGAYDIGSPERNNLEAKLAQQQAALQTKARQAEADLLNREAGAYYKTYMKMQEIVSAVAKQNNISLVLRFDSNPIKGNNRAEVIKGVNRAVVYHRRLDLTNMVIQGMQPQTAQAPSGVQNK